MSKAVKKQIMDSLEQNLTDVSFLVVTSFQGLNVAQIDELRKQLRTNSSQYKIVKNRLTGKVLKQLNLEGVSGAFEGPTGLVIQKGDPVAPSKVLVDFSKNNEKFVIRAGYLEGKMLDIKDLTALAKMPSRPVMLGKLAGALNAPIQSFASALNATISSLALVLSALKDKKEKEN